MHTEAKRIKEGERAQRTDARDNIGRAARAVSVVESKVQRPETPFKILVENVFL